VYGAADQTMTTTTRMRMMTHDLVLLIHQSMWSSYSECHSDAPSRQMLPSLPAPPLSVHSRHQSPLVMPRVLRRAMLMSMTWHARVLPLLTRLPMYDDY
jgi:hypothetical protein